ncbi:MAG: helix-turn-helix domain-containing protein [Anaerolineae bacterium]|nr:helix-turn-helix domain-containing protein [Anaerolineae bacterium]
MSKLVDAIGQFATVPNTFIEGAKGMSHTAFRLFVTLRYYTNGKTGDSFPSYDTLQELTGMNRRTIAKAVRELEAGGWIERKRRFSQSTIYTIKAISGNIATNGASAISGTSATDISGKTATAISGTSAPLTRLNNQTEKNQTEDAPAPAAPPSNQKPRAQAPIPSSKHPAIAEYIAAFGFIPNDAQRAEIVETATNIVLWRRVLKEFKLNHDVKDFKRVGWMLENYRKGLSRNGNGHAPTLAPGAERVEYAESVDANGNTVYTAVKV